MALYRSAILILTQSKNTYTLVTDTFKSATYPTKRDVGESFNKEVFLDIDMSELQTLFLVVTNDDGEEVYLSTAAIESFRIGDIYPVNQEGEEVVS